jgi:hypothetical protein
MKKIDTKKIDFELLAESLSFDSTEDAIKFLNDGRIMGRVGEFWKGERQNENSPFDVKDESGFRLEVRSITDKVSFASSKEVGYGRSVTEEGFNKKLNSLDKYLLLDMRDLENGNVSVIEISKDEVLNLPLGKNKSISAQKFYDIYDRNK